MKRSRLITAGSVVLLMMFGGTAVAQDEDMTFFVSSAGPGDGANRGGLEGADAHCAKLAKAAGSSHTNWRAYLSTTAPGGEAGVNARDRIGKGPWHNAKGELIAKDVAELHSDANNITKETALNEKGEPVSGRGDDVNRHDILTGSDPGGEIFDRRLRYDLRKLDQERRGIGHRRSSRPPGAEGYPPHDVLELVPRHSRLQPGCVARHRW